MSDPPVAAVTPKTELKPADKRPLNSLNWTEEQLAEQEAKILATIKPALDATQATVQNRKIGKRLALAEIRKLPRPLRNLLLHLFESNKWRQLSIEKALSQPTIPEWKRRMRERMLRVQAARGREIS